MKKGSRNGSNRNNSKGNETEKRGGKRSGRDIKNARSLADVLGKGSGPGGGGGGPSRPGGRNEQAHNQSRRERDENHNTSRDDFSPNRSKGPTSSKLQYIMSFQPPEQRARETSRPEIPVRDPRAQMPTPHSQPSRPQSKPQSHSQTSQPQRSQNQPQAKRETKSENNYSWPKERVARTPAKEPAREETRSHRVSKNSPQVVSGLIKRHPDGFGFLIPDSADVPDVYVARQGMTGVMTNDRVEVEVYRPRSGKGKDDRLSGEIIKILTRANKRVVGKYLPVDQKYGVLQDENRGWGVDLKIAAADSMNAKEGQLVAVEILQYPDDETAFTGKVISIIGNVEDPVNDVIRVVHQSGIPNEFSKEAIADAAKFGGKVTEAEREGREDLTSMNLITIDGTTAKDFDDAIHTEQTAKGFKLTVAIADVSHYVKPGTRLDEEAYDRGTSTYFPNYVVPMLPEELSNELCSLKPHVLRLCFCCEMFIDFDGEVQSYRFFEGVMESKARVTYGEAQEVIDAHASGEARSNKTAQKLQSVTDNILKSADLAKILMNKRFAEGSLDLEIPETQVVVDSTGESTDIIKASRLFAHRLIEELMLITNVCTARYMENAKIPGIYRVHETPDQDNIQSLQQFLFNMGGKGSMSGGNLAKKLTKALESMQGKPEAQILNILTLRTMKQAHYSEQNVGHFGLGFSHYSHFTSPIRRYPDLIAHRLIKSRLYKKYEAMAMDESELQSATTWLSATEQRSTKAERKVISIKKARFIRRFIDQEFEGMISSVAKFGVFVLLRQYDVDGLVKIENLGNDRFEFDEENLRLVGRRSGTQYTIGDQVKVVVKGADPESGKVDFELSEIISQRESGGDPVDAFFDEERGSRGSRKAGKPGPRKKARGDKNSSSESSGKKTKRSSNRSSKKKSRR